MPRRLQGQGRRVDRQLQQLLPVMCLQGPVGGEAPETE